MPSRLREYASWWFRVCVLCSPFEEGIAHAWMGVGCPPIALGVKGAGSIGGALPPCQHGHMCACLWCLADGFNISAGAILCRRTLPRKEQVIEVPVHLQKMPTGEHCRVRDKRYGTLPHKYSDAQAAAPQLPLPPETPSESGGQSPRRATSVHLHSCDTLK